VEEARGVEEETISAERSRRDFSMNSATFVVVLVVVLVVGMKVRRGLR
jgi:hypothetical protein